MQISSYKPYFLIIAVMLGAVFALAYTVDVRVSSQAGVRMELPPRIAGYQGSELRFCHNKECEWSGLLKDLETPDICPQCGDRLHTMTWQEYEALPKDTEFIKSRYENENGDYVHVSIVLSGKERNSIHRPQRCLPGQGHVNLREHDLETDLPDGTPFTVRVIESERKLGAGPDAPVYNSYYAYWFAGRNRETPHHLMRMFWLAWDRVVHSVAHRWAYISVAGSRGENQDSREYEETVRKFVRELQPALKIRVEKE